MVGRGNFLILFVIFTTDLTTDSNVNVQTVGLKIGLTNVYFQFHCGIRNEVVFCL